MKKKFYKKTLILIFGGAVLFTSFGFKSDFFEIAKQIEIFTTLFKEINMNYVDETSPAMCKAPGLIWKENIPALVLL